MKILILSYSYPPLLNPRAFRWSAIAEQWASEGHDVDVICRKANGRPNTEVINGVHVHRAGGTVGDRMQPAARAEIRNATASPSHLEKLQNECRALARNLLRYGWRKLYWPDYTFPWYWPTVRTAKKLLSADHYDIMYSSSIPFTGHLAGLALKKKYPHLRWVVDIGDPFCFADGAPVNNFKLYSRLNIRAERRVFSLADSISVTTEATKKRYHQIFPFAGSKITVIPPLLSASFGKAERIPSVFPKDAKIRLVFLGTLYKDIRNPTSLLACFAKLLETDIGDRLELHFFGEIGECRDCFNFYNNLLDKKIFLHGLVPQNVALQAMREASILINIGNNTLYQLPSKVVEYLAMMKPILNFVNSDQDSSAEFFRNYEGIISISGNGTAISSDCITMISDFVCNTPSIDLDKRSRQLEQFRVGQLANVYREL